MVKSRMQISVA